MSVSPSAAALSRSSSESSPRSPPKNAYGRVRDSPGGGGDEHSLVFGDVKAS